MELDGLEWRGAGIETGTENETVSEELMLCKVTEPWTSVEALSGQSFAVCEP